MTETNAYQEKNEAIQAIEYTPVPPERPDYDEYAIAERQAAEARRRTRLAAEAIVANCVNGRPTLAEPIKEWHRRNLKSVDIIIDALRQLPSTGPARTAYNTLVQNAQIKNNQEFSQLPPQVQRKLQKEQQHSAGIKPASRSRR